MQTAPPCSVNGPSLTVLQIQCTTQIDTDTVQSHGSCIFSNTVHTGGLRHCASLAADTCSASFLAKKKTVRTSYSTLCQFFSMCFLETERFGHHRVTRFHLVQEGEACWSTLCV